MCRMAGKIYVTGDCHYEFKKFNMTNFPEQKLLDKEDYIIICGDFGGVWNVNGENSDEKYWMDWLDKKSYTTLFVDGNHENFDRLNSYPIEQWKGGTVHKIRSSVIHLMRGQIYDIAEKKFFTFGGASSHDTQGGILDMEDPRFRAKKKFLDRNWIPYRVNHINWWKEEQASEEEQKEAEKNLQENQYKVDYIITHCCSSTTQDILGVKGLYGIKYHDYNAQTDFFDKIKAEVEFSKWYFGHYHMDRNVTDKEILLYDKIIPLGNMIF